MHLAPVLHSHLPHLVARIAAVTAAAQQDAMQ
jgi:hypothetical protein